MRKPIRIRPLNVIEKSQQNIQKTTETLKRENISFKENRMLTKFPSVNNQNPKLSLKIHDQTSKQIKEVPEVEEKVIRRQNSSQISAEQLSSLPVLEESHRQFSFNFIKNFSIEEEDILTPKSLRNLPIGKIKRKNSTNSLNLEHTDISPLDLNYKRKTNNDIEKQELTSDSLEIIKNKSDKLSPRSKFQKAEKKITMGRLGNFSRSLYGEVPSQTQILSCDSTNNICQSVRDRSQKSFINPTAYKSALVPEKSVYGYSWRDSHRYQNRNNGLLSPKLLSSRQKYDKHMLKSLDVQPTETVMKQFTHYQCPDNTMTFFKSFYTNNQPTPACNYLKRNFFEKQTRR